VIDISTVASNELLRVIIAAGEQKWPGWIATQQEQLDLLKREDWEMSFAARRPDRLLCEHCWEHLTESEGRQAAKTCFDFLPVGGNLRVAVPDGNFRNEAFQKAIAVGQHGHQVVYVHKLFADVFAAAGFEVDLLEYCDAGGRFHFNYWSPVDGPVYRSLRFDHRNKDGQLGIASIILDARKQ
jgi:predicted SAM-dependent methyltransferase